jgi:hypothetical protein
MFRALTEKLSSAIFGSVRKSESDSSVNENECREIEELFDMEVREEGRIYLLDLNEMLMEKILSYLAVSDLATFSRVSRSSKEVTRFILLKYHSKNQG